MSSWPRVSWWVALLVAIALAAWFARSVQHRKVHLPDREGWVTTDPDSLRQLRRIEGIFRDGLPPAEFDEELSWPAGSAIPAPPYYPVVAWACLAPFAPDSIDERRGWLEQSACTLPALFGVLAALVAAWVARPHFGFAGALFVGLCFAVAPGAILHAGVGNADYHSFSTLLCLAQLGLLSAALRRDILDRPKDALRWGIALGLLHGIAIGAWTPALIQLVLADAVLGGCILLRARTGRLPALPHFGLALHVAALVALAPAVLSSPWRHSTPWILVNLSWFHAAFLALGAAVFVPLFRLRESSRALRSYPWTVFGALAVLGLALVATGAGPGAALREAFSWAGAENEFMSQVAESAPLVGAGAWPQLALYLGYGAFAAPLFALGFAAFAWRERRLELAPWIVALFVFGVMAARQMRFAELVVVPLAFGALATAALLARGSKRLPQPALLSLGLLAALGLHYVGVRSTVRRAIDDPPFGDTLAKRAARMMSRWLRENTPPGAAVMSMWGMGNVIQWAGERPVVASAYGLYVGEDAYFDSFRCFATGDPAEAERLLIERDVRYVFITSAYRRRWNTIASALDLPDTPARLRESFGAQLLGAGRPADFLRLVHMSPLVDPKGALDGTPSPGGLVFERVAGAWIEARGEPGDRLDFVAELRIGARPFRYAASAVAGAEGTARVRTPYSSAPAGDVTAAGPFQAHFAGRKLELRVPDAAVRDGRTIELE